MSLQAEWQYLCSCISGVGQHLAPLEDAIRTKLILALIQLLPGGIGNNRYALLSHGVKTGGISIRNPVEGTDSLFDASESTLGVLVASLLDGTELEPVSHSRQVRVASMTAREKKVTKEKVVVDRRKAGTSKQKVKRLKRIGHCGIWLSMAPLELSATTLSFDEFIDSVRLEYKRLPNLGTQPYIWEILVGLPQYVFTFPRLLFARIFWVDF